MASNSNSTQLQELNELRNRLEWLDEERRKLTRKLAEVEQRVTLQKREIEGREQRIQDLERQVSGFTAQLARVPQVDTQLGQFKDDIVQMIEQYDQRRLQSETEMDRLRRVEQETIARELADIRKEIAVIPRLQNDLGLRQAEEGRLAHLIGVQQNKISALENQVENWQPALAFLEEKERQNGRNITETQANLVEINKRWAPIYDRLDVISNNVRKVETNIQAVAEAQTEVRESTKGWMEQIQIGEYERNQKVEKWRRIITEHTDTIERFSKEWITFSDQFKEAKMAVQTLAPWQTQMEQQQREASELLRVEAHRLQSRWDDFLLEHDKKWKNFEFDSEQRWIAANRQSKQLQEQLVGLDGSIDELKQDKELLWRVQTAQADAIKKIPLMWMEEVEKAIAQNPNRRRQPALVPVREE
jgi:chromosome segregation ATPase